MFKPELINTFKTYNTKTFISDLIAGVIVGIVALPLAIAFAIASGVNPAAGLFTAIIAGFCISAFGGSRVQIGGPTGAFAVIVYGVVAQYGLSGLATAQEIVETKAYEKVLRDGAVKAKAMAKPTLERVQEAVGLLKI